MGDGTRHLQGSETRFNDDDLPFSDKERGDSSLSQLESGSVVGRCQVSQ